MGALRGFVGALGAAVFAVVFVVSPVQAAGPAASPAFCPAGQQPAFLFGFSNLQSQIGDAMGTPTECQHPDPSSGDTIQHTTTGIAVYQPADNLVTFTNGYNHWAATATGLVTWTGDAAAPPPPPAIPADTFTLWHGVVREGGAYRRAGPSGGAEILEELDPGTPIRVDRWVAGPALYPDVIAWGQVDDAYGGGYIYGGSLAGVLPPTVPPVPAEMASAQGPWIDVNLTLNVVTAYQDGAPRKSMLVSPGRPGYDTDTGVFSIGARYQSQRMVGPGYDVPGVPWVQYFDGAEALHGRYWTLPSVLGTVSADAGDGGTLDTADSPSIAGDGPNVGVAFGVPSSHGCLGVSVADSAWLYQFAGRGVTVDVHY